MAWLWLKNLMFTAVVPATVALYGPLALIGPGKAGGGVRAVGADVLLVAGAALYAWTVWEFAIYGRGTPAPIDAPRRLVIVGPYRRVRNPMYLGVLTVIAGWICRYGQAVLIGYWLAVAAGFHLFVLVYEEPHLRRRFPLDYPSYCLRVRRWLPRWQPDLAPPRRSAG
jgi:protein-S-isoprenylcysteine O-methyltransferase Ste14